MFIPPPGMLLLEVDYSQAELRVVAELAKDKAMIEIFRKNWNIHVATACKINGGIHLYDKVKSILKDENHKDWLFWEKQKKRAKTINFGILYGQTEKKLSKELDCTEEEAKEFIQQWYAAYPQVKKWIKKQQQHAHEHGYVMSLFGRKRRLYESIYSDRYGVVLEAERQAVNTPIQGTASDFGLLSQIVIRELKLRGKLPAYMQQVYTVHDSIGYYIKPEDISTVVPEIVRICDNPNTLEYFGFELKDVRMKVSPEIGKTWFDKHDWDPWTDYSSWVKKAA
jgi:DNA polymerase-1